MQKPVATWDGQRDCWIAEPYPLGQRRKIGLYEHWGVYSGTFPNQGTMRNGQLYPQPRRVPRTYESESSSLLPTVTTQDGANNGGPAQHKRNTPPLNALLPTVMTQNNENRQSEGYGPNLGLALIPTVQSRDWKGAPAKGINQSNLSREVAYFGPYQEAIDRWESLTRPVPEPTEPNRNNKQVLSADFCEWMMGLPKGHVQGTRNQRIKQAGNGVVVPQAELALRRMMEK